MRQVESTCRMQRTIFNKLWKSHIIEKIHQYVTITRNWRHLVMNAVFFAQLLPKTIPYTYDGAASYHILVPFNHTISTTQWILFAYSKFQRYRRHSFKTLGVKWSPS